MSALYSTQARAVGGRAHARLDLAETVEHLIESGLGKTHVFGDL